MSSRKEKKKAQEAEFQQLLQDDEVIRRYYSTVRRKDKRPTHNEWLTDLFELDPHERVIDDFSCAIQKSILLHGRLYVTQSHLCFYSNIFGFRTEIKLAFPDITSLRKKHTVLVVPNALEIRTEDRSYLFASFAFRDQAFRMISELWNIHRRVSPRNSRGSSQAGTPTFVAAADDGLYLSEADLDSAVDSPVTLTRRSLVSPPISSSSNRRRSHSESTSSPVSDTVQRNGVGSSVSLRSSPIPMEGGGMNGSIPEQHTNAEGLALTPRGQSPHSMAIGSSSNVGTPSNHSFDGYESAQEGGESFLSSAMKTVLQPPLDDFVEEFPLVIEKEFPEGVEMHVLVEGDLPCTPEDCFNCLVRDGTDFWASYHKARGDTHFSATSWEPVSGHSGMKREVLFKSKVTILLASSMQQIIQQQRYWFEDNRNRLVVDISHMTPNVPNGKHFRVQSRFDFVATNDSNVHVTITMGVAFLKDIWFKDKIRKESKKQCTASYTIWRDMAVEEISRCKREGKLEISRALPTEILSLQQPALVQQQSAVAVPLPVRSAPSSVSIVEPMVPRRTGSPPGVTGRPPVHPAMTSTLGGRRPSSGAASRHHRLMEEAVESSSSDEGEVDEDDAEESSSFGNNFFVKGVQSIVGGIAQCDLRYTISLGVVVLLFAIGLGWYLLYSNRMGSPASAADTLGSGSYSASAPGSPIKVYEEQIQGLKNLLNAVQHDLQSTLAMVDDIHFSATSVMEKWPNNSEARLPLLATKYRGCDKVDNAQECKDDVFVEMLTLSSRQSELVRDFIAAIAHQTAIELTKTGEVSMLLQANAAAASKQKVLEDIQRQEKELKQPEKEQPLRGTGNSQGSVGDDGMLADQIASIKYWAVGLLIAAVILKRLRFL